MGYFLLNPGIVLLRILGSIIIRTVLRWCRTWKPYILHDGGVAYPPASLYSEWIQIRGKQNQRIYRRVNTTKLRMAQSRKKHINDSYRIVKTKKRERIKFFFTNPNWTRKDRRSGRLEMLQLSLQGYAAETWRSSISATVRLSRFIL